MGQPDTTFQPQSHEQELLAVIREIQSAQDLDAKALHRIVRRHPKSDGRTFSKSEIIRGYRYLARRHGWSGSTEPRPARWWGAARSPWHRGRAWSPAR